MFDPNLTMRLWRDYEYAYAIGLAAMLLALAPVLASPPFLIATLLPPRG